MPHEDDEWNGVSITFGSIALLSLIGVLIALTRGVPTCDAENFTRFPCLGWEVLGVISLLVLGVDIYFWSRIHSFPASIDHA